MADLERAIQIAERAHRGQVQRNGQPYILHPLRLMNAVSSVNARIAAVLHDVVEDAEWELDGLRDAGFGPEILAAVDCLTHRAGEDYDAYVERIAGNPLASEVKLADLQDNMNVRRLPEVRDKDLERLRKYHRAWRRLGGDPEVAG